MYKKNKMDSHIFIFVWASCKEFYELASWPRLVLPFNLLIEVYEIGKYSNRTQKRGNIYLDKVAFACLTLRYSVFIFPVYKFKLFGCY